MRHHEGGPIARIHFEHEVKNNEKGPTMRDIDTPDKREHSNFQAKSRTKSDRGKDRSKETS